MFMSSVCRVYVSPVSVLCQNAKFVTDLAVTVLVHLCIYVMPRDTQEGFLNFRFFRFLVGLSLFLRWNLDHFQIEFLWFLWVKWTILRLHYVWVYCVRKCTFWDIALCYHFMWLCQFLRWNSDHFQIEFLWFLWGEWTILRLFYLRVYFAKMCSFWDVALF